MMVNTAVFTCSICGEASAEICAYCTKDACSNHRCARCKRCSDCCECEVPLSAEEVLPVQAEAVAPKPEPEPAPPPAPEHPRLVAAPFLTPEESTVFAAPYEPEPEPEPPLSHDPFDPGSGLPDH